MRLILFVILFFFIHASNAEELPLFFDSGIDSFILLDQKTTLNLLKDKKESMDLGFHTYEFNLSSSHLIRFIVHPGSVRYEISEIQIIKRQNRNPSYEYSRKGITQKGILLGISKEELISKIGNPTKVSGNNYEYSAEFHDGILKKYNMPIYYGKYTFLNNSLVSFSFGFEYP